MGDGALLQSGLQQSCSKPLNLIVCAFTGEVDLTGSCLAAFRLAAVALGRNILIWVKGYNMVWFIPKSPADCTLIEQRHGNKGLSEVARDYGMERSYGVPYVCGHDLVPINLIDNSLHLLWQLPRKGVYSDPSTGLLIPLKPPTRVPDLRMQSYAGHAEAVPVQNNYAPCAQGEHV